MLATAIPFVLLVAQVHGPTVRFSPSDPRLGDLVTVYLESDDRNLQSGTIDVFGCRTSIDRVSAKLLRGFVAVPSDIEPGAFPLTIDFGQGPIKTRLPIDHRPFETSTLRVSRRFTDKQSPELRARLRREAAEMFDLWKREPTTPKAIGAVLRPVNGHVTSPFGVRRVFNGKRKSVHYGLDLEGQTGDPIRAALNGRIAISAMRWVSGGTTIIDHGGGLFSAYFHMSRRDKKVGDYVEKGDLLGAVGKTGRVTGPHLHLAVMTRCLRTVGDDEGETRSYYIDPERFLTLSFEGDPDYLERPPDR